MYSPFRKGIFQLSAPEHSGIDISFLGKLLTEIYDYSQEISGDILTGLYGKTNSVAYQVAYSHGDNIDALRDMSGTFPGELVIIYVYQDKEGAFIKVVIESGRISMTGFCNPNTTSILYMMMWGSDETDTQKDGGETRRLMCHM